MQRQAMREKTLEKKRHVARKTVGWQVVPGLEIQPILEGRRLIEQGWKQPRAEIHETKREIIARMGLPGIEEEDVQVGAKDKTLVVKAERKTDEEIEVGGTREMLPGHEGYYRVLYLPAKVTPEEAQWELAHGVLEVRMQKA